MLRRTKTSSKKRHSVFIDIRHSMAPSDNDCSKPDMYQAKNKSLEELASEARSTNTTKRNQSRSKLKRSSVLLDNTMVRDYNLAISHFEKLDTRPIQSSSSDNSISSNSSTVSSLFSSASTTSIRDLLYEDLEECCEEECEIIDKNHLKITTFGDGDKGRLRVDDKESSANGSNRYRRTDLQFE